MDIFIVPFIMLLKAVLSLAYWVIFVYVIISLLCTFNIINLSNRYVSNIVSWIYRLAEPPLNYIGRFIPPLGNIDITPIVLILILAFFDNILSRILLRFI